MAMLGFLFVLVVLTKGQEPDPNTGLTSSQVTNILNEHNEARRTLAVPTAANMLELQWDPLLAQTAFNYLTRTACTPTTFVHNPTRDADYHALGGTNDAGQGVGENYYSGGPDAATDTTFKTGAFIFGGGAVSAWTVANCFGTDFTTCTTVACSEADNFYGRTRVDGQAQCSNTGDIGHFTQVMWATTGSVGCGFVATCGTLCNYAPAGNVGDNTQQANVWKAGTPGSQCPLFMTNVNGLCSVSGTTAAPPATTATPAPGSSTPAPGSSTPAPVTTTTKAPTPTTTKKGNLPPPPPGRVIFPKPATPKPTPKATPKATVKQGANKKKKNKKAKNVAKKKKTGGNQLPTATTHPIFPKP